MTQRQAPKTTKPSVPSYRRRAVGETQSRLLLDLALALPWVHPWWALGAAASRAIALERAVGVRAVGLAVAIVIHQVEAVFARWWSAIVRATRRRFGAVTNTVTTDGVARTAIERAGGAGLTT